MVKYDAKSRINELIETIKYHNERYYGQDEPEISDAQYDELYLELKNLESEYPHFVSKLPSAFTVKELGAVTT